VVFRKTARNFNHPMATAAALCVVEVEEVVPVGSIDADAIHLPGIFVDRILLSPEPVKHIEFRTTRESETV
jgi:3-oxoacid CoA-transferase subunit A